MSVATVPERTLAIGSVCGAVLAPLDSFIIGIRPNPAQEFFRRGGAIITRNYQ
ncbi:MAG: hypothetical protein JWQ88_178 [Rhodoferax sp.]|nr:hypothetical protein [Rhodoferax sp.]